MSGQPETGKTLTILQGTLLPSFGIFPWKKMDLVLKGLRTQLDADYEVLRPAGKNRCIEIVCAKDLATSDLPRVFRV